ncbi:MAG: phage tail sheath family protein [Salibacteraceae bacterium]
MSTYNIPGVTVEEISTFPRSVVQVSTAVPGFIGYTDKVPTSGSLHRITSLLEFEDLFGGLYSLGYNATSNGLDITLVSNASGTSVTNVAEIKDKPPFHLYRSMRLYFANGGGPCWVASAGTYGAATLTADTQLASALASLSKIDEVTLLVAPDAISLTSAQFKSLSEKMLTQCATLKDRFTILDTYEASDYADANTSRGFYGNNNLSYGAAYFPFLNTDEVYADDQVTIKVHTGGAGTHESADFEGETIADILGLTGTANEDLRDRILPEIRRMVAANPISVPPSGAIAGVMCAVDRDRGVWKAPANVSLTAITGPRTKLTENNYGNLNVDTNSGKSINAIRTFTGKGDLVFGARTLNGASNAWRYVPVRRLFITVEESIAKATAFSVFEPNDANTWSKLKAMIENYLAGLWRQGALAGPTPEQSFFVNVGLGSTMTPNDILEGRLIIEVGIAAVRPAEFIILKFSHKLQEA